MKNNFQIIILVIFMVAAVFSLFVFSGAIKIGKNSNDNSNKTSIVLWGTVESQAFNMLLQELNRNSEDLIIKYVEKSSNTFDSELLEALATNKGPDLFLISDDLLLKYKNKIMPIPYESMPISVFKETFTSAGEIFLDQKGVLALPLAVDPLMLYYNRGMFDAEGIAHPPTYWDEVPSILSKLNKKDEQGNLKISALALGQFNNINNARYIISTLFMQSGNPIVTKEKDVLVSRLSNSSYKTNPASILEFYTNFTDPLSNLYSWNRSFGNSKESFSRESLAMYFGFASELKSLLAINPNQNFGVASVPQVRDSGFKLTSGKVWGIAISPLSKNTPSAFLAANRMTASSFASKFGEYTGTAPVRRELLKASSSDSFTPIFYASAFFARSWLNPSPVFTEQVFRDMVEKVLSNSLTPDKSVREASDRLQLLLSKVI